MASLLLPGTISLVLLVAFARPARADTVELVNGTRIEHCLARDEGLSVLVWESRADFPDRPTRYARHEVRDLRIERGASFDEHENLQDLSVTHIEITPKLAGLHGVYSYNETGAVRLQPRTELGTVPGRIDKQKALAAIHDLGDRAYVAPEEVLGNVKLRYEPGEAVTLTAHIVNTGFATARPFDYVWHIDGTQVASGHITKPLAELERTQLTLPFKWQDGLHETTFKVIPGTSEIASFNDARTDALWGFAFFYVFSNRRVAYAHEHRNTLGSFSLEDYYQWHLDIMNDLFEASVYPSQPEAIKARVRLDRIIYLDEVTDEAVDAELVGADGLGYHQGGWIWRDNDADRRGEWHEPFHNFFGCVTEWSLPHELGHQLGLVDLYNWDYHGRDAFFLPSGQPVHSSHFFRHPEVMMHWHGPNPWSESTAAYLNRTFDKPRGIFGDYVFETPDETWLLVLDVNGRPIAGADVELFQRATWVDRDKPAVIDENVTWWPVIENGDFPPAFVDMHPVIKGTTDTHGYLKLPNRPVQPVRTLNGYERRPNPFGNINVVGGRGLMLIKVENHNRVETFWLELIDLNLTCIRGNPERHIEVLRTSGGSPDSPTPPVYPRLLTRDGRTFRLAWVIPQARAVNERPHRFKIYRRVASEGLNFEPWELLAVLPASQNRCDAGTIDDVSPRPALWTEHRRISFGISTLNERGVESAIAELPAPRLDRTQGLLRRNSHYFLQIEDSSSLWRIVRPGVYEDWTPSALSEKAGERYDVNSDGHMVSSAWDRHCVNLYEAGSFNSDRYLGHPFEAGDIPGRMRHVRDCSINGKRWVAAADSENRRIVCFDDTGVPQLIVQGPAPDTRFESRIVQVRWRPDILLARDEHGTLWIFRFDATSRAVTLLERIEGLSPCNFDLLSTDEIVVLLQEPGLLRLYNLAGTPLLETDTLHGVKLEHPRGLVVEEDGSITVFNAFAELLTGRLEDPTELSANSDLELQGVFEHPIRYVTPVLRPRVFVINYDPLLRPPGQDRHRRLHELGGWADPHVLASRYTEDLRRASGGYLRYEIEGWIDVDGYPKKVDSFQYDDESYWKARETGEWHDPDGMDYEWLIEEWQLSDQVRQGTIDEVWVFGAPYFGYYESRMVGPGAYECNSPGIKDERSGRLYVIMGFNYERGVAEMIHDLGHRLEATMSHVYEPLGGPWRAEGLRTDWERFSALEIYHPGRAGVGNCHFPCNGESHYDYDNARAVTSFAEDWLSYPDLTGRRSLVSAATWDAKDRHLAYMHWLFTHLPRAPGRNEEGMLCNWWEYLANMSAHAESRGR
ncbi:MAG: hypothetical protein AB1486_21140 [Planctomycetota bacterium]